MTAKLGVFEDKLKESAADLKVVAKEKVQTPPRIEIRVGHDHSATIGRAQSILDIKLTSPRVCCLCRVQVKLVGKVKDLLGDKKKLGQQLKAVIKEEAQDDVEKQELRDKLVDVVSDGKKLLKTTVKKLKKSNKKTVLPPPPPNRTI